MSQVTLTCVSAETNAATGCLSLCRIHSSNSSAHCSTIKRPFCSLYKKVGNIFCTCMMMMMMYFAGIIFQPAVCSLLHSDLKKGSISQ